MYCIYVWRPIMEAISTLENKSTCDICVGVIIGQPL